MNLTEIETVPKGKLHYCDDCRHAFDRYSTFAQPAEWYGSCPLCGSAGRQLRSTNHERSKGKACGYHGDCRERCVNVTQPGNCRKGR